MMLIEQSPGSHRNGNGTHPNSYPLSFAPRGERVTLMEIRAGNRLRKRLSDLGLHIGMQVRVVQDDMHGPLILAVTDDARLALGRGMAQKIMVERVEETH